MTLTSVAKIPLFGAPLGLVVQTGVLGGLTGFERLCFSTRHTSKRPFCAKGLGHRSRALVGRRQSEGPWKWEDQPRRLGKAAPRGGSGIWKANVSHCTFLEISLPLWWCESWQIEGFLGSNMDGSTLSCCDNWCVCTRVCMCICTCV